MMNEQLELRARTELYVEAVPLHVVPSYVNGLYTPLGSIDSLPPPYLPRLSGESNPVIGEQKRLSTYWSARTIASAGRTNGSACRTTASAGRTNGSAAKAPIGKCRTTASA